MKEVTATQAAVLTGLSERTIRRRIASGALPARHIAPNRFAIDVRHLPRERAGGNFATRLEMLERRVQLLEMQQQALLRRLDVALAAGEAGGEAGTEAGGDLGQLHDRLMQMAHETERLAPLLSGGVGSAARETSTAVRSARGGKTRKSAGA
jgi:hypothetical protein